MFYLSSALTMLIFLMFGIVVAKKTMKYKYISFDFILVILTIISLYTGRSVFLFKMYDFQINLSIALESLLLGILLRRFTLKHSL